MGKTDSEGVLKITLTDGGHGIRVSDAQAEVYVDNYADNIDKLKEKIVLLMENDDLYLELSKNALQKGKAFSSEQMVGKIKNYLHLI